MAVLYRDTILLYRFWIRELEDLFRTLFWVPDRYARQPLAPEKPWREMPKRVRPYGSAVDAEYAALARNRSRSVSELSGELASTTMARDIASQAAEAVRELNDLTADGAYFAGLDDVRDVIASLRRMSQDLPRLCEQLARIMVAQREDGHPGPDPEFWVTDAVESLAAAGQAADMMAAALAQAGQTPSELRPLPSDR